MWPGLQVLALAYLHGVRNRLDRQCASGPLDRPCISVEHRSQKNAVWGFRVPSMHLRCAILRLEVGTSRISTTTMYLSRSAPTAPWPLCNKPTATITLVSSTIMYTVYTVYSGPAVHTAARTAPQSHLCQECVELQPATMVQLFYLLTCIVSICQQWDHAWVHVQHGKVAAV